jgi:hypothetical protein
MTTSEQQAWSDLREMAPQFERYLRNLLSLSEKLTDAVSNESIVALYDMGGSLKGYGERLAALGEDLQSGVVAAVVAGLIRIRAEIEAM